MDDESFNCVLLSLSDDEKELEEVEFLSQLAANVATWHSYCKIAGSDARKFYEKQQRRVHRFLLSRNGHMFMMEAMTGNGQLCYQEFRMYPQMVYRFGNILCEEYGLVSSQQVDVYEKLGMFLCILAHGKGYRQVTTIFNHSLQTICHYFKEVLRAVVRLAERLIRSTVDYNNGVEPHKPDRSKHLLFEDCIGAIDGTHIRAVLPRQERVSFIGRKGVPTQNVLAACDFNLCFTFVLAGYTENTHDARMLARAIYDTSIHFPQPAPGKYYLVDSGFAHRPGYMAPYKGLDILYQFQQFRDERTSQCHRFRNAREKFNFKHSSCRNIIERAFGVWKQRWKILDRMPSYPFPTQVGVVIATMGVHNFLRHSSDVDEAFHIVETEKDDEAEVDLPSAADEEQAKMNAPEMRQSEWDKLRDYMAQQR